MSKFLTKEETFMALASGKDVLELDVNGNGWREVKSDQWFFDFLGLKYILKQGVAYE